MFSTLFPPVLQTVHSLRQGSNDSTTALMRPEAYFFLSLLAVCLADLCQVKLVAELQPQLPVWSSLYLLFQGITFSLPLALVQISPFVAFSLNCSFSRLVFFWHVSHPPSASELLQLSQCLDLFSQTPASLTSLDDS